MAAASETETAKQPIDRDLSPKCVRLTEPLGIYRQKDHPTVIVRAVRALEDTAMSVGGGKGPESPAGRRVHVPAGNVMIYPSDDRCPHALSAELFETCYEPLPERDSVGICPPPPNNVTELRCQKVREHLQQIQELDRQLVMDVAKHTGVIREELEAILRDIAHLVSVNHQHMAMNTQARQQPGFQGGDIIKAMTWLRGGINRAVKRACWLTQGLWIELAWDPPVRVMERRVQGRSEWAPRPEDLLATDWESR